MMIKYFHELTDKEIEDIPADTTCKQVAKKYPQPKWCEYPNATHGAMGCWGLVGGRVREQGKKYCANCECNKELKKQETVLK
jgi:hypothetical protein